jgi:hypothetical protein
MIELSKEKGESILNEGKEEKGTSILNENGCSETPEKQAIIRLYTNIGRNGLFIFMITSYLVKDEDDTLSKLDRKELISIESLRGFTYEKIAVQKVDTISKRGYAVINDEINIPLTDLDGKSNKYFFEKNEVIKECKKLMEIEYNTVKSIMEVSARAESFIKRAIEKNSK